MKRFLLILTLLCWGGYAMSQTEVFVYLTDGTTTNYTIQASGAITFVDADHISIKESLEANSTTIDLDNVRKITFADATEGIGTADPESSIRFYPNPAQGYLVVEANGQQPLSIYAIDGREVLRQTITNTESIDISSLKAGIYILRMNGSAAKFIKGQQ